MKNNKLSKQNIKQIINYVNSNIGIKLTNEQVLDLMNHELLKSDWNNNSIIDIIFEEKLMVLGMFEVRVLGVKIFFHHFNELKFFF